jgi:hypothetical protein
MLHGTLASGHACVPKQHLQINLVVARVQENVRKLKEHAPVSDALGPSSYVIAGRTWARMTTGTADPYY